MEGPHPPSDYWGAYYGKEEAPVLPSQFALFVANEIATGEIPPVGTICDIGCGNGRDALFFLQLGYAVRGLDASDAAVAVCRQRLSASGKELAARGRFHQGAADAADCWQSMAEDIPGPVLVYARFFFHAIDDAAELEVLAHAASLIDRNGGALCAEFRTQEDRDSAKATPAHYRRFIDPDDFAGRVVAAGLKPLWQAKGRGMAKYREDDAHVARIVAIA
ncbi:MAG: class I SAM-dependent methyltransferase [Novosphingobium sp.]